MLNLCVCVKLWYVTCVEVEAGGGRRRREEAEQTRDTESKTRTPHKVVGKKTARSPGAKVPATFSGGGEAHRRNGGFQQENH